MGAAAPFLMAAGTIVSAYGMIEQGRAANKIAKHNAKRREVAAQDERRRGAAEGETRLLKTRRFLASQVAEINSIGGQVGGATELEIAESTGRRAEIDFLNTLDGAEGRALSLEQDAQGLRFEGAHKKRQGYIGGAGKLIQGGGQWAQAMGEV